MTSLSSRPVTICLMPNDDGTHCGKTSRISTIPVAGPFGQRLDLPILVCNGDPAHGVPAQLFASIFLWESEALDDALAEGLAHVVTEGE